MSSKINKGKSANDTSCTALRGYNVEITGVLHHYECVSDISQWIGCFNVIRNQKIRNGYLKDDGSFNAEYSRFKKDEHLSFLKDVPCQILRSGASRLFDDYKAYRSGKRDLPKTSNKFKKRYCYVPPELFTVRPTSDNTSLLYVYKSAKKSDRGSYLFTLPLPFPADTVAKSFTISRLKDRFWLSIAHKIEIDNKIKLPVLNKRALKDDIDNENGDTLEHIETLMSDATGLDIGMTHFVTTSDNVHYDRTEEMNRHLEQLRIKKERYERQYTRKQSANDKLHGKKRKRTGNERVILTQLNKLKSKEKRIKRNHSHKLSRIIADSVNTISVFEDMMITNLIKSKEYGSKAHNHWLHDCNLGQLRDYIKYKLDGKGKRFVNIDPAYTSQTCHCCGHTSSENRVTQDKFECIKCGYSANADHNAALNIQLTGTLKLLKLIPERFESMNATEKANEPLVQWCVQFYQDLKNNIRNHVSMHDCVAGKERAQYRDLHFDKDSDIPYERTFSAFTGHTVGIANIQHLKDLTA